MSAANLTAIRKGYDRPEVRDYLEEKSRQDTRDKHTGGWGLPTAAAGLIGAGLGATYLGDKAITPGDRLKLDNLSSLASRMDPGSMGLVTANPGKEYQGSGQLFYDYVDRASEAATAKIFGRPVQDIIEMVRKSPLMRGSAFDISKANKFDLKLTDDHYKDFTAGPLAAYHHQLAKHDESFGGSWGATKRYIDPGTDSGEEAIKEKLDAVDKVPGIGGLKKLLTSGYTKLREGADVMTQPKMPDIAASQGSNGSLAAVLNQLSKTGPEIDTYHKFRQHLDTDLSKYLKVEGLSADDHGVDRIRDIATGLPHGRQMDLLRKFRGWVGNEDPAFSKALDKVEPAMADGMTGPARFYSFGGNTGVRLLQDLPRAAGAAMLAGGAGLGTWWMYSKLREHALKNRLKEKQLAAMKALKPMTNTDKLKAAGMLSEITQGAGGGAVLGGLAGAGLGALRQATDPETRGHTVKSPDGMSESTSYNLPPEQRRRILVGRLLTGAAAGGAGGAAVGGVGGYVVGDMQNSTERLLTELARSSPVLNKLLSNQPPQ